MEFRFGDGAIEVVELIHTCRQREISLGLERFLDDPDRLLVEYRLGSLTSDLHGRLQAKKGEVAWVVGCSTGDWGDEAAFPLTIVYRAGLPLRVEATVAPDE